MDLGHAIPGRPTEKPARAVTHQSEGGDGAVGPRGVAGRAHLLAALEVSLKSSCCSNQFMLYFSIFLKYRNRKN